MSGIIGGAGSKSGVIGITEIDYEEGTWTPVIDCEGSGSFNLNSSYNTGSYIRIGNQCTIAGYLQIDSESSPSGQMNISLPFVSNANSAASKKMSLPLTVREVGGSAPPFHGLSYRDGKIVMIGIGDGGAYNWIDHGDVDTSFSLWLGGTYLI
jgi:hypothetical protein